MKKMEVEKAIGEPLAHDVIKYGPNTKRTLFQRGHQIREGDIEKLKDSGYFFVYISEGEEEGVHENEAALRMAKASAGENLRIAKPEKGRVRILSESPGLLKAKTSVIKEVNLEKSFIYAYRGNNIGVKEKEEIASVKIAPLAVSEKRMKKVESILKGEKPVLEIKTPKARKIGAIITGTEVYEGRIDDVFEPTLRSKLEDYGLELNESILVPDDKELIKEKIQEFTERDFEVILVTGGMAVDSKDVTPSAIRDSGAQIVRRGVPIFPGNMLMVAQLKKSYILGVPACALPDERTSFDIILPRVLAKETITKDEIAELGENGILG